MTPHERIDLSKIKPSPLKKRKNKVGVSDFASINPGTSFEAFWKSLPDILAAEEIRYVARAIERAKIKKKPVIWMMGAHVIKVGLAPMLVDLMKRGYISAVALNGAGVIHDTEVALIGGTSEDVAAGIKDGTFGMSAETSEFINGAIADGVPRGLGLGESVCERLVKSNPPHAAQSLLWNAGKLDIPVTVHIAMGTDIIHIHPQFDPAAAGEASHRDFRAMASVISKVGHGGVILNIGSTVILPLIIEKSLSVARNLGHDVVDFTGVNLDFVRQYRPGLNPVSRANELGGRGIYITGHHELNIPLLYWALRTGVEREAAAKRKR